MQLQTYEGYWENGLFQPLGHITRKSGKVRAILTILNEAIQSDEHEPSPNQPQLDAFNAFITAIHESDEEPVEFERADLSRVIDL